MAIPDSNMSTIFAQFASNAFPFGDYTFLGLVIVCIFAYLFWGLGISQISALMLGFLLIGTLHFMFGGIFTMLFIATGAVIMMIAALTLVSRLKRVG